MIICHGVELQVGPALFKYVWSELCLSASFEVPYKLISYLPNANLPTSSEIRLIWKDFTWC